MIGLIAAGGVAVYVVQIIIPWEAVCAAATASQGVLEAGSTLIDEIESWIVKSKELLASGSTDQTTQASSTLGGLVSRAQGITDVALDVVAAPLRTLIDSAQVLLATVQAAVDSAREAIAAVEGRC